MAFRAASNFLRSFRDFKKFNQLDAKSKEFVFYAEAASDWLYFEGIVDQLISKHNKQICYVASQPNDPILDTKNPRIRPFYIGEGTFRTLLFQHLKAKIAVMTMPDLESFYIKRSMHGVHYVYVFHSLVSTHMIYREQAFDAFDTILTVGPHHDHEIQARETKAGLKPKRLIPGGYHRLDALLKQAATLPQPTPPNKVIIAPSWGKTSITSTCLTELISVLIESGYPTTFRPHPMSLRKDKAGVEKALKEFGNHPLFTFENDLRSKAGLHESSLMISDWSGAAFEYAFAFNRPVVFIDVERKVNNPNYQQLGVEPMEVVAREDVGAVVRPDQLQELKTLIPKLLSEPRQNANKVAAAAQKWVYNLGHSGEAGANALVTISEELS